MSTRTIVKVSEGITIAKPLQETAAPTTTSINGGSGPSVVLIFGWMDAKFGTLLKYSQAYDALFPQATHVIVQQNLRGMWLPAKFAERKLLPLVRVLADAGVDWNKPAASRGLLVHTFSNGGCWRLVLLGRVLRKLSYQQSLQDTQLPPTALIFDSCPGRMSFRPTLRAVTASLPSRVLKLLLALVFVPSYFARWLLDRLLRRRSSFATLWHAVARADALPWTRRDTPRAYLYSREDIMVPAQDVEEHVALLRADGAAHVRAELFAGSAHVAHARSEPERYWRVVRETWEAAVAA